MSVQDGEGNLTDFDLFLPSVQFAMNGKASRLTASTPFALVFGRPLNYPRDFGDELLSGGHTAQQELSR